MIGFLAPEAPHRARIGGTYTPCLLPLFRSQIAGSNCEGVSPK